MEKVRHCQIHLTEPARSNAADALFPASAYADVEAKNAASRAKFTGPHFHDIQIVQCSDGTVDVHLPDGTVYMYPLGTVARIKVYETKHTPV